jgi:ribosomal protein S12 methylthiotransferase accessory factor
MSEQILQRAPKVSVRKPPADTLRDVQPYLKEAGVTRLTCLTGMDRLGIPVYASIRPDSQSLAVDSGKGYEPEQAKCSAAMESLERWACDEAKLIEWEGYAVGNCVTDFPLTKGAHFNPTYPHLWTEAKAWTIRESVSVPLYTVKIYKEKIPLYRMCWQGTTNGLAAGNDIEEAICAGLYERIERDAVSLYMNGADSRIINNDSIEHEDCREMLEMCDNAGVGARVYEATSDIGVPVFGCIMVDRQINIGLYKGFGCHLDSHVAMRRAICEAAQSRAVFISGARDDMTHSKQQELRVHGASRNWDELLSTEPMYDYVPSCQELSNHDTIVCVEEMLKRQECGRVLVVQMLERPSLAVVRVLVPKLEGYWTTHLEIGRRALR